ncbi:MAG: PilZ domain-containing protein [Treponema sp.]|nr:PilZ domain-containing protein [Treponema sp.]
MNSINRKVVRYKDFGRVDAPDICLLAGILEDISFQGCKVRFPVSINIDMETDYELKIHPSRKQNNDTLLLLCHPQWQRETESGTEIGFQTLRSPDTAKLNSYIKQLVEDADIEEKTESIIVDPLCQFV